MPTTIAGRKMRSLVRLFVLEPAALQQLGSFYAKRSTGPRTDEGKARSRLNGWKHDLAAEDVVIYHEDPRAFEALRTELLERLAPRPGLETMLVERIAAQEWRLRRIPVLEAAALDTFCVNLADAEARWEACSYEDTAEKDEVGRG
jgi:hypothetical protein